MSRSATAASRNSFASTLAGFTATSRPAASAAADGLEDDIATISYEKALRAQQHKRAAAPVKTPSPATPAAQTTASGRRQPVSIRIAERVPAVSPAPATASNRRSASVTVRLTDAEFAQLRERAAAAGISASAYMRSCLVDAEALRAQVRQALEQFRAAATPAAAAPPAPAPRRQAFFARWFRRHTAPAA